MGSTLPSVPTLPIQHKISTPSVNYSNKWGMKKCLEGDVEREGWTQRETQYKRQRVGVGEATQRGVTASQNGGGGED
jgi:hypothetical protein